MQQTIQQTAEYYLSNLPNDQEFYYLEDFESSNFPSFLTRRIQLALFQKLSQSVSLPQTKWADVQNETVAKHWHRFVSSLKNTARVPADQIEPLLRQAVTDSIHILVEPRQNIPELLFEEQDTLTTDQLTERVKWLVVYPHFGQVLTRYVQRKDKSDLSRSQCDKIITQVDEK